MGVSGFWAFYLELVKVVPVEEITGKYAFIDIILYLHKYIIGIRKGGFDIITKNKKNVVHIHALTKIIKNFTDQNILPICVFDGKSPLIKSEAVEKRREIIEHSREKCEELNTDSLGTDIKTPEYIKHFKRSFSVNHTILSECKEYLKLAGLPYVDSVEEADPQCAAMAYYYKNICSGAFSEDSDIILYGAPSLYRTYDVRTKTVSVIHLQDILTYLQEKSNNITSECGGTDNLQFTRENLIDFSIIMGNDYCQGIRCSKQNNRDALFKLFVIAKYNVELFKAIIDEINLQQPTYIVPDNFIEKWKDARTVYTDSLIINPANIDVTMNKPDYRGIEKYLSTINFRNDIIVHIVNSLFDLYSYFNKIVTITFDKSTNSIYDDWTTVKGKRRDCNIYSQLCV